MTWYDLMDNNTPVVITSPTALITVNSGRFRVFGNQPSSTLSNADFDTSSKEILIYPNPAKTSFSISKEANLIEIYTLTGQLVNAVEKIQIDQQALARSEKVLDGLFGSTPPEDVVDDVVDDVHVDIVFVVDNASRY